MLTVEINAYVENNRVAETVYTGSRRRCTLVSLLKSSFKEVMTQLSEGVSLNEDEETEQVIEDLEARIVELVRENDILETERDNALYLLGDRGFLA